MGDLKRQSREEKVKKEQKSAVANGRAGFYLCSHHTEAAEKNSRITATLLRRPDTTKGGLSNNSNSTKMVVVLLHWNEYSRGVAALVVPGGTS